MHSGSITISLVIHLPEDAFLTLQDLAFRTAPCVRHLLPRSAHRHTVLRIALGWIINPVAFQTDPACILFIGWHGLVHLLG